MDSKTPNQREIAKAAGVSVATVSLALRNHPSIPETTRVRIREVAEKLGYRPNPRVAELMGHIRKNRSVDAFKETVALIWSDIGQAMVRESPSLNAFEQALQQALQAQGMGIQIFYQQPDLSWQRLEQILHARGIRGLILAPLMREDQMQLDWNWTGLSVVLVGSADWQPEFNRVRFNHFAEMGVLLSHIQKMGRRRMGMVIEKDLEARSQHAIDGGFWAGVPDAVRKKNAIFELHGQEHEAFFKWLYSYQPDSLIVGSPEVLRWIGKRDSLPPIFLRSLEGFEGTVPLPGIRQNYRELGQVASKQLIAQLQLNQSGVPARPLQILITGELEEPDDDI